MSINKVGLSITETSGKKSLSIYIHIPFCGSKCAYCSFVSVVGSPEDKKRYFAALLTEISIQSKKYREFYSVSSIYIGGGTPSCMDYYLIRDLLSNIYKNFAVKNSAEITIELNPNTVDKTKIREYILSGVNRFSIGLQSTSSKILKAMGRTHTVGDYEELVGIIKDYGIKNISTDIIIGYPGQKLVDVKDTIDYLISLEIPHISVYMLSVEEGTRLKKLVDNGSVGLPDEDLVIQMYNEVYDRLSDEGYTRYEFSNFSLPTFESFHNRVYWNRKDYLGMGLAAHSYIDGTRFANTENIIEYARELETNKTLPVSMSKTLSDDEKKEEMIMLSLRTKDGFDINEYKRLFNENFLAKKKEKLTMLITEGYMLLTPENRLVCTDKGFLVLNRIVLDLID